MAKIGLETLKTAEARASEYVIWDDALAGFGLRVRPTGSKAWIVQYRIGTGRTAKQRKISLGPPGNPFTPAEARTEAKRILAAAGVGQDAADTIRAKPEDAQTVRQFIETWAVEGAPFNQSRRGNAKGKRRKVRQVEWDAARLRAHVVPVLGSKRLIEVEAKDLERLKTAIATGKTATTEKIGPRAVRRVTGGDGAANGTLRVLRSALGWAVKQGMIETNPADRVDIAASGERDRPLSATDVSALGAALDAAEAKGAHPYAIAIITLLALTGARKSEIEGLRWSEIDFDSGRIVKADTKTGKAVTPLSEAAEAVIKTIDRQEGKDFVFPATAGEGYYQGTPKVWRDVRAKAGLDDVRLHDLRHHFATMGVSAKLSLPVIGRLLAHSSAQSTSRYAHAAIDTVRAAGDELGGQIAQKLGRARLRVVEGGK